MVKQERFEKVVEWKLNEIKENEKWAIWSITYLLFSWFIVLTNLTKGEKWYVLWVFALVMLVLLQIPKRKVYWVKIKERR